MAQYGFNVTIGADTRPFATALRQLNQPIQAAQTNLKRISEGLRLNPTSTSLMTDRLELLGFKILDTKNKVDKLKEARDNLVKEANGNYTEEQYRALQSLNSEIDVTEAELKQLQKEYAAFGQVGAQQALVVGQKMQEVGQKIQEVGEKLKWISAAAGGALIGIVKTSVDFEDAWVGVTKTVDGTDEELAKVRQEIIEMSKATGISKNEIAGVAQVAGQLGIKTGDLSSFTKVMVDLGVATNMSAEEAAMSLARLANITQMSSKDYDKLGATITDLGNHYAVTEREIVDMATRLASTGDLVGLNQSQILALSAAMGSLGTEAEAGGTALSKMFKKMQLAIETNNEQLPKFAKVAGMSVREFKDYFEKDALGALNAFTKGLAKIEEDGGSAVATLDDMKLSEVRLSDALLRLVGSGDLLTNTINTADKAWNENTALTNEASKRYDEVLYQWGQVKETLGELAIDLGEILLPIIKQVLERVKEWIEKFNNMDDGQKKMILTLLGVAAAASPVLIIIGKLVSGLGSIVVALASAKIAIAVLGAVLGVPLGAILGVIAAIGALIGGLVLLYNKCEWFRNAVNAVVGGIVSFVTSTFETIKNFITVTIPSWLDTLKTILDNWPYYLGVLLANCVNKIWEFGNKFKNFTSVEIPAMIDRVKTEFSKLPEKIAIGLVMALFKIGEWVEQMKAKAKAGAENTVNNIENSFRNLPQKLFMAGVNAILGLIQGIESKVGSLMERVRNIASQIAAGFQSALRIGSPSKLMRDLVGKNIILGIEEGFVQNIGKSVENMQGALLSDLSEMQFASGGSTTVNIYTQELDSQKLEQITAYVNRRFGAIF